MHCGLWWLATIGCSLLFTLHRGILWVRYVGYMDAHWGFRHPYKMAYPLYIQPKSRLFCLLRLILFICSAGQILTCIGDDTQQLILQFRGQVVQCSQVYVEIWWWCFQLAQLLQQTWAQFLWINTSDILIWIANGGWAKLLCFGQVLCLHVDGFSFDGLAFQKRPVHCQIVCSVLEGRGVERNSRASGPPYGYLIFQPSPICRTCWSSAVFTACSISNTSDINQSHWAKA